MNLSRAIQIQSRNQKAENRNAFLLSAFPISTLVLCLLCPPNFMASEPSGEITAPLAGTAPVVTGTTDAATNSEIQISPEPLGKPVVSGEAGKEITKADTEKLLKNRLEQARNLRRTRLAPQAEPILVELLQDGNPDSIRQPALLELALCAQDQNDLPRALQIYSQFLSRWPNDPHMPEILLRQGQFFRQMGLNSMALAKFYSVMTAALALKNDQLDYYKRLVVQAQTEIAETHYQMGKYADAAEYFARLLKQGSPLLNRLQAQYRLLHALSEIGHHDEAVSQAQDFLTRYPDAADLAEVRFALAHSLKELGRNGESLQQVLSLLQEQKSQTAGRPEVWAYWQQRAGNEIANQLYREGDYTRALDVYLSLAQIDPAPTWQIPVNYQIGMTYERLQQPQLASLTYSNIVSRELETGTNASPGLKSVFDMARWRINFINWQSHAENSTREFAQPPRESVVATDPKS
jgi:tetratricopeptide (TPR) repeat protein